MKKFAFWFLPFFVTCSLWFPAFIFTYHGALSAFGTTWFIETRGGSMEMTVSKWKDGRNYAPDFGFTRYSPQPDYATKIDPFTTEIWHPGYTEIFQGKALFAQENEAHRSYVTLHLPFWLLCVAALLFGAASVIMGTTYSKQHASRGRSAS